MKYLIVLLTCFYSYLTLFSQNEKRPFINEYSLSLTITNTSGENYTQNNFQPPPLYGFSAGAFRRIEPENWMDVSVGAEISRISYWESSLTLSHFENARDIRYQMYSLTIPASFRFYIGNHIKLNFSFGGHVGLCSYFNIHFNYTYHGPDENMNAITYTEDVTDSGFCTPWLHGAVAAGTGIVFPLGQKEGFLHCKYSQILTEVHSIGYENRQGPAFFQITAGYRL